jgi:hypothetical protein
MTQDEFNAIWDSSPGEDFDPPACEEGMVLLKEWAEHDSALMQWLPLVPEKGVGPFAQRYFHHVSTCPNCNEEDPDSSGGRIKLV